MPRELNPRFKSIGVEHPSDLLLQLPAKYHDFQYVEETIGAVDGREHLFRLEIASRIDSDSPRARMDFILTDSIRAVSMTIWGSFFGWDKLELGDMVNIHGRLEHLYGKDCLTSPQIVDPADAGKIVPVYKGKKGQIAASAISTAIKRHFHDEVSAAVNSILNATGMPEQDIASRIGFPDLTTWFKALHFPGYMEHALDALTAANRIAVMEVVARGRQTTYRPVMEESAIAIDQTVIDTLLANLPLEPTTDQIRAIAEITNDIRSNRPMRRLLSGDVGTGKTLAFLIPAIAAFLAGAKVAIMVPATLLIKNAIDEARAIAPGVPIEPHVPGEKLPENCIVVGTSSIIGAAAKQGIDFSLVVIDEQHRFGNETRKKLLASYTNYLEGTATAIPRSLALVTHGGMEVSVLRECPVVKDIETRIVTRQEKGKLFQYLKTVVGLGHQIAFVYPLVTEESELNRKARRVESQKKRAKSGSGSLFDHATGDDAVESIQTAAAKLEKHFPGRVGYIYGDMPDGAKSAVLSKMQNREIDVLAASTAIELGVTVPSLSVIVLVNPGSLGLASLHQLRGRVARHGGKGMCFIYLPHEVPGESMERYRAFSEIKDGFILSEKDLERRGMGDVGGDGIEQSGKTRTLFPSISVEVKDIKEYLAAA